MPTFFFFVHSSVQPSVGKLDPVPLLLWCWFLWPEGDQRGFVQSLCKVRKSNGPKHGSRRLTTESKFLISSKEISRCCRFVSIPSPFSFSFESQLGSLPFPTRWSLRAKRCGNCLCSSCICNKMSSFSPSNLFDNLSLFSMVIIKTHRTVKLG